jgi:apolipoprotein N-acyltransferase
MSKRKLVLLSLCSGLLLTPAWYRWGSGLFLLIALVPLLFVEHELATHSGNYKKRLNFFLPFLAFFTWNALSIWWIKNASLPGMIFSVFFNTTVITIPFWLFSLTHRKLGNGFGYFSFIFYWMAFEYLYVNGEISFTWLNLGNGFAHDIKLVQWYEYTGVQGGTLWILLSNLFIFKIIKRYLEEKSFIYIRSNIIFLAVLLFVPIGLSLLRFVTYKEKSDPHEIVVIQPNIDPYMKFNDIPPDEQINILIHLADSLITKKTDYIAVPETFINNNVWLDQLELNPSIRQLKAFLNSFPKAKMIIGATTYKAYRQGDSLSETARPLRDNIYYDSYNTALQIDSTNTIQYYHKSQLVVGVEKMPYTKYLGFLKNLTLRLGGTFRNPGTQKYRSCLIAAEDNLRIAPVICYESIFGEYVTDYITQAGANMIFVITNDGWWGDTPGYIQHNSFSCLRAIETRRSIARSANTGISCFINQKGEILQKLGWWERGAIRDNLNANDKITFYVRYGDYLGRISTFFGIIFLLYTTVKIILNRKKSQGIRR